MNVSKEQKQKPSLGVILMGVFIVGTLIAAFAVYGLPQIVIIFREIRIVKEMEDVYAGTNFKNCKCSVKRLNTETVNSRLNSREEYEGFKNAKLGQTGFNMGYSMLKVYLSDASVTEEIDEKLIEAEFPYAVRYYVGDPDDVTGRDIIELPAETKYYPEKSY